MKKQLMALAQVASSFEKSGNLEAGRLITQAMKKIAQLDDDYDSGFDDERFDGYEPVQKRRCSHCGDVLGEDDYCDWCGEEDDGLGDGEHLDEREDEDHWYDSDPLEQEDLIDGVGFADPGGQSALRAETPTNRRTLPCPTCGEPNKLTPLDKQRGYQCDECAARSEGWGG